MTSQEKKQAERVIRAAKELERPLFHFIAELEEARLDGAEPYSWTIHRLRFEGIQRGFDLVLDLMKNTEAYLADHPGSV